MDIASLAHEYPIFGHIFRRGSLDGLEVVEGEVTSFEENSSYWTLRIRVGETTSTVSVDPSEFDGHGYTTEVKEMYLSNCRVLAIHDPSMEEGVIGFYRPF